MDPLVSLVALIEPQDLNAVSPVPQTIKDRDLPELADLYLDAYAGGASDPDAAGAAASIHAVFAGARGAVIPQASMLSRDVEGRITAAIITTERTFRSDKPKTAFIAELFTHPDQRGRGLAELLLRHAMQALHESGYKTLAVTINSANAAAQALYLRRDFRRFTPAVPID
ncbi:GNAT family N-acetyltransferase [Arthrobacter sp. ISL-85]|uniref:GNAT family N-acetyltransferase n=1 Tax=Arthrobacter sp. ISL-85 TaxID=2819115 RepID=UPI001BED162A|nr:GNAT family N-acetyltransferase [Arthrobacter sp. ISL-85]MBT2566942.1 GNAT family N-acetyltransferase [Arthrobacter sp. ISL-85]